MLCECRNLFWRKGYERVMTKVGCILGRKDGSS